MEGLVEWDLNPSPVAVQASIITTVLQRQAYTGSVSDNIFK